MALKVTTVTIVGVHPCTYVTEDVNVCILNEGEEPNEDNCWNEQNCKNRRQLDLFNENSQVEVVSPEEVVADSSMAAGPAAFLAALSLAFNL